VWIWPPLRAVAALSWFFIAEFLVKDMK